VNAPNLRVIRVVESCEAAHAPRLDEALPWELGYEPPVPACAHPSCLSDALPGRPMCLTHWIATPSVLRGRWGYTLGQLHTAVVSRPNAVGRWARMLVEAEAALVASLTEASR